MFSFCSKDQGWSGSSVNHGTYENCWSWFDAVIENNEIERGQGASDDLDLLKNRRCHLQSNRHAGREIETYRLDMIQGEGFLKEKDLRVGDEILLVACARFPGWANNISRASIEIWEVDDMNEDYGVQG